MEQVLYNLLVNAWLAVGDRDAPRIVLTSETAVADQTVVLAIEDNGPGVPEALQEGLFDAFVSTRTEIEGLGLGLAISRQFMETMGGTLELVTGSSQKGARFELTLPLVPPAPETKEDS